MASKIEGAAETALNLLFNADNLTADKMQAIAADIRRLAASLQTEVKRVKAFKFDIHWKSRVINVPIAIDRVRDLIEELTNGLREKILTLEQPFKDFQSAIHAAGHEFVDPQLSKVATSFSKVEDFVTSLNILVGDVAKALQAALSLTALFDRVLQDLQHLDDIFLQQKSTRTKQTVTYYKRAK